jgi:hypothetical protein
MRLTSAARATAIASSINSSRGNRAANDANRASPILISRIEVFGIAKHQPPLLPEAYGIWSLTPSLTYFNLNEDVQYKAADSNRFVAALAVNVDF